MEINCIFQKCFFRMFILLIGCLVCSVNLQSLHPRHPGFCEDSNRCNFMLRNITENEELSFAQNEEDLKILCGKLKDALRCFASFTSHCLPLEHKHQFEVHTNGTRQLIKDLCSNGTSFRKDYMKHANCYRDVAPEYNSKCTEHYYKVFDLINKNPLNYSQETMVKLWCCNIDNHKRCTFKTVYNSMSTSCSTEAAIFAEKIIDIGVGPVGKVHCQQYTNQECKQFDEIKFDSIINDHSNIIISNIISLLFCLIFVILL